MLTRNLGMRVAEILKLIFLYPQKLCSVEYS